MSIECQVNANEKTEYSELVSQLYDIQKQLQSEKYNNFHRRVSFGDLITERDENAARYGFGEGTTCYDNVLIIGDVKVGKNVWIGPNVILDGSGGLIVGDNVSICAGVQIYTHDTVAWATSMGVKSAEHAPTNIGSGVYIGPNTIIQKGVSIGNKVVIGAMSFVNEDLPDNVKAWGTPARIKS